MNKICSICKKEKPLSEFYSDRSHRDGRSCGCKECIRNKRRKNDNTVKFLGYKFCPMCETYKELSEFGKNKSKGDGYQSYCKVCKSFICSEYRSKPETREKIKVYRDKNRDHIASVVKNYYESHKDEMLRQSKEYRVKHKENYKKTKKEYHRKNKDSINRKKRDKRRSDVQYRISCYLRSRLGLAIRSGAKTGSAVKDLGCSVSYLKNYLRGMFYPNPQTGEMMTWNNWSADGWHIHHINPLSSFDLGDRNQFLRACHYTNLKPLWKDDHVIAHTKKVP